MLGIKDTAVKAALAGGGLILESFQDFNRGDIKFKSKHEILTPVDLAAEKEIMSVIRSSFPDHNILSEEAGDDHKGSSFLWVVDPLDGTTNFSMHNPLYSTSIGIFKDKQLLCGVVFAPFLDELYVAEAGQGAYLMKNGEEHRMNVSDIGSDKALNTFCHGSSEDDIKRAVEYHRRQKLAGFDCRQLGSAAIEFAFVACGRTESIVIPGVNSWDVAAGALLVREAGGEVTDWHGNEWGLESRDIVATNKKVRKDIMGHILGI
jgi:myo-inositol-1(or 4)-monophosphatase